MKTITTILTILCLLQSCYSQKQYSTYIDHDNDFLLINNERFSGKDTLVLKYYENGKIRCKGYLALGASGDVTSLRIGNWIEYYSNGVIKSSGQYQISSYIDCGTGGLERIFYNYKIGEWIYFNQDSTLAAKGTYNTIKTKIDTRCEGGDNLVFMTIADDWQFNQNDEPVNKTKFLTITNEFEDGFKIDYFYDIKADKVIMKFGNK